MEPLGRTLILIGTLLLAAGLWLSFGPSIPGLGRLPGDIDFERSGVRVVIPIASCLVISVVLSAIFWIVSRFR